MSKLGYFLGGALAGIIGTAVAAYAVDACSSPSTGGTLGMDSEEPVPTAEDNNAENVEAFADTNNDEPCTA